MGGRHSKRAKLNGSKVNTNSGGGGKKYLTTNGTKSKDDADDHAKDILDNAPSLTDEQKQLVAESWSHIEADMNRVGVVMFMKLFETHPDVQDVFEPFKGKSMEDLKYSNQLRSHALRVMGTVEKCLARINEPKKLQDMLHDLGSRHVMYSAKVDYIDLIGPQFIWAIEPVLGDKWTPELEQAWSDLFKFISHIMKEAMTF
ncbi:neuroglobin-like [Gigantopelta aegis]|uniref:neuroglobin-like n=1 Tax=Gigantopelta aegis TaxID=1735272 RepID=UPI001B88E787|nr:neuroglobin-like [Gigantopelta aegis]